MLARDLNFVVEKPIGSRPGPERFEELFRRRLEKRRR